MERRPTGDGDDLYARRAGGGVDKPAGNPAVGGLPVDQAALNAAALDIGITRHVTVEWDTSIAPTPGSWRGIREDGHHRIALLPGRDPAETTWHLFHEMTHAAQCDRHGYQAFLEWCNSETARVGNDRDGDHQREANTVADQLLAKYAPGLPPQRPDLPRRFA